MFVTRFFVTRTTENCNYKQEDCNYKTSTTRLGAGRGSPLGQALRLERLQRHRPREVLGPRRGVAKRANLKQGVPKSMSSQEFTKFCHMC